MFTNWMWAQLSHSPTLSLAQRGFRHRYQKVTKAHNPTMEAELVRELPSCLPVPCRSIPQAFQSQIHNLLPRLDCPNFRWVFHPFCSLWDEGDGAGITVVVAVGGHVGMWPPGFCTKKPTRSGSLRDSPPFVFSLRA